MYNIKKAFGIFSADFEEISILYLEIKKMLKSQTIKGKKQNILQGPPPLTNILVKNVLELRRTLL